MHFAEPPEVPRLELLIRGSSTGSFRRLRQGGVAADTKRGDRRQTGSTESIGMICGELVPSDFRPRDFPDQVTAPPRKPAKDASGEEVARWEEQRKQQSSRRICVEHAIAEPKRWRPPQRYTGRREHFDETFLAIATLVSDRCALR